MRRALVLAITLIALPVAAHVAPSVDDNNRYLKLTPAADRVRLAYTVFFGEVPGAQMRRTVDGNHDGTISDAESQAFGEKLAAEVAAALELTVDKIRHPVTWTTISVGMGTPATAAGAFSVDMVAWACLPSARGKHTVHVRDRFRIPRPGETEAKVEDGPGITIEQSRVGTASSPTYDYRFVGPGGPLSDDGLEVAFVASDKAPLTDGGVCKGEVADKRGMPTGVVIGAAAVIAFVLAAIVALVQRRRRRARG